MNQDHIIARIAEARYCLMEGDWVAFKYSLLPKEVHIHVYMFIYTQIYIYIWIVLYPVLYQDEQLFRQSALARKVLECNYET
jgi:hypothetical protein